MKKTAKQKEVDKNFDYFQKELPNIISEYEGKFAVLRKQKIVEYLDTFGDACKYGKAVYADNLFSVQEVTQQVADLGFMGL